MADYRLIVGGNEILGEFHAADLKDASTRAHELSRLHQQNRGARGDYQLRERQGGGWVVLHGWAPMTGG